MSRSASTTPSRTFISPAEVSRCSKCEEYLSVGPITRTPDSKYTCGRCNTMGKNVEYYDTSSSVFLPCRYDANGCKMFIKYGDVLWHENRCAFKTITCPAVGCNSKISKTDLLKHFKERHQELIITKRDLPILMLRDFENRLYVWENQLFIVQTRKSGYFVYIRATTIEKRHIYSTRLYYRVKCFDKNIPVSYYGCKIPEKEDMLKLSSKQLETELYFDIYDRRYEKLTSFNLDKYLTEIRCSVCRFYTLPSTYTCKEGHNFCGVCSERLKTCNQCQTCLQENRSLSLQYLGQFIKVPCSYRGVGCKLVGKPQEISRHEQTIHVWNPSEVECVNVAQGTLLNLRMTSFDKTFDMEWQGTMVKIVIRYTKDIGMTAFVLAQHLRDVGLKYDLELSAENRNLRFEDQIVYTESQNDPEHHINLTAESLEHVTDSCGMTKLTLRIVAYR